MNDEELVAAGFHRLDQNLIENRPPKIKWGGIYKEKSDKEKIEYLEKLASSMNHAARLIQNERDELLQLCEKKEAQLGKMDEAVRRNNEMLQQEVARMNKQRQGYNQEVARLNARIREFESDGDHHRQTH